jgi:outer membrane lipoprotein carrier protein
LDSNTNQWQNYSVTYTDERYLVKHNSDNSQLELAFDGNKLKEITMVQAHGERTELMLSDVALNTQIDDQQFTFKVPAGVDVDDQS